MAQISNSKQTRVQSEVPPEALSVSVPGAGNLTPTAGSEMEWEEEEPRAMSNLFGGGAYEECQDGAGELPGKESGKDAEAWEQEG